MVGMTIRVRMMVDIMCPGRTKGPMCSADLKGSNSRCVLSAWRALRSPWVSWAAGAWKVSWAVWAPRLKFRSAAISGSDLLVFEVPNVVFGAVWE